MVLPRSAGTFLISRVAISWSDAAVSMSNVISAGSRSRMARRSFRVHAMGLSLLRFLDDDTVFTVVLAQAHGHALAAGGRQVLADVIGADGQLAVTPVDQDRELHRLRAAEIDDGVERGTDRPSGEQHVVHQDDGLAL